jgi:uncharacterized protein (DUF486 family)
VDCSPNALDPTLLLASKQGPIDYSRGSIYKDRVPSLLEGTIANDTQDFKLASNDYVVIHILKSKDKASGAQSQEVESQQQKGWSDEQFATNKHVLGVDHIYLLYIHLNRDADMLYSSDYSITVASKLPTNLNNLFNLLGAFTQIPASGANRDKRPSKNMWGWSRLTVDYKTSDIDIKPTFNIMKDSACATPAGSQAKNITPIKLDNEGKAFFDFSVGVPISKISQLQFNADQNTISPQKVDTTNAFGLLNLYYPKVDLKYQTYSFIPHFVGGIAFAKQPLHKILLGIGIGPNFAQFYIGAVLNKEQVLPGNSCSSTVPAANNHVPRGSRFCPQFSYGLNIPVGGLTSALKKSAAAGK